MSPELRLRAILLERSVRRGRFTLASGKESDFYVDVRQTSLHAEGAALLAEVILSRLLPAVQGIGGPVTGADPIAGAVAAWSFRQGRPVHGFMVRKEPKGHGTKQWVEGRGNLPDGSRVCVVEDTVTSGGSLLTAVRRVQEEGLIVVQTLAVVDREEGGADALREAGLPFEALFGRTELLS